MHIARVSPYIALLLLQVAYSISSLHASLQSQWSESPQPQPEPPPFPSPRYMYPTGRMIYSSTVPSCARDVVVRLYTNETSVSSLLRGAQTCHGILLQDDLVLTSRDCAHNAGLVDVPGLGWRAATYRSDFNRAETESILAFVEVDVPTYHRNSGWPRQRAFLSLHPGPGSLEGLWCHKNRPIIHAVPVKGHMVSISHLYPLLPNILWKHRDLDSAPELSDGKQYWWARWGTKEDCLDEMSRWKVRYQGPDSSKLDIISERNPGALLEAEDPKGHRYHICLSIYYRKWHSEEPFSGERFFDWLDYGRGRDVDPDHQGCGKEEFNGQHYKYLNADERKKYAVEFVPSKNGKFVRMRYAQGGRMAGQGDGGDELLFVWGLDETFYAVEENRKHFGHASPLAAGPALSAGEIEVGSRGRVTYIDFGSGHYRPVFHSFLRLFKWMMSKGLNVSSIHWERRSKWSKKEWDEVFNLNNVTQTKEW